MRIKSADSKVLRLSVLSWCGERPQTAMLLRMIRQIKVSSDRLRMHFCRPSLRCESVLGIGRLVIYLFLQYVTFCKECKFYSRWHWLRYRNKLHSPCKIFNEISLRSRQDYWDLTEIVEISPWCLWDSKSQRGRGEISSISTRLPRSHRDL